MSSAIICGVVLLFLAAGYKFYGSYVEKSVIGCDECNEMPADAQRDGVDFEPTKPIILFGHHFSSIAGAGPIVGPIIALLYFGWAATLGWICIGTVFAGAVHDYVALMVSARQNGRSLADISENVISKRAGFVFSIFLWAALILVIAAFGVIGAKSLISKPAMVFPTFMLIPIAMMFGWATRRTGMPVWLGIVIAVGLNFVFIYVGQNYVHLSFETIAHNIVVADGVIEYGSDAFAAELMAVQVRIWFPILMGYCIVASLLPVWLLMQPRDYICVYKLFIGLSLGLVAIILFSENMKVPAFTGVVHEKGGPMWPMLFVIVACGAISGFHSVVAGGTTVKQLRSEKDGKPIAFGGMVLEGVLAMLTVCLVGAGLMWAEGSEARLFAPDLIKTSPLVAFANGFGHMVGDKMLPFIGFGLASLFGMVMLKTFVLTSLDTCTRLARFVSHELVGERLDSAKPGWAFGGLVIGVVWLGIGIATGAASSFWGMWLPVIIAVTSASILLEKQLPFFRGRLVGTVLSIAPAFYLGFSGSYTTIWPMFGASNQLIAALALIVGSCYLLGTRRSALVTAIPAVFMLFTTVAALLYNANGFLFPPTAETAPNYILGIGSVVLALLGLYVAIEAVFAVPKLLKKAQELPEPEVAAGGD